MTEGDENTQLSEGTVDEVEKQRVHKEHYKKPQE